MQFWPIGNYVTRKWYAPLQRCIVISHKHLLWNQMLTLRRNWRPFCSEISCKFIFPFLALRFKCLCLCLCLLLQHTAVKRMWSWNGWIHVNFIISLLHYRHNLQSLPDKTDNDCYFKSKCRQMFVSGLVTKFGPWGGQNAVAALIGVDQSTVSRGSMVKVTSPFRTNVKRKRRDDCFEATSQVHIPTINAFWVSRIS